MLLQSSILIGFEDNVVATGYVSEYPALTIEVIKSGAPETSTYVHATKNTPRFSFRCCPLAGIPRLAAA